MSRSIHDYSVNIIIHNNDNVILFLSLSLKPFRGILTIILIQTLINIIIIKSNCHQNRYYDC